MCPKRVENTKRIQLTLTEEQYRLLARFKGILGQSDSEVVRNIILSWLAEKSFISTEVKQKVAKNGKV